MNSEGKWTSTLAHFYYFTGAIYYLYEWLLVFGLASLVASGTAWWFSAPTLTAVFLVFSLALLVSGISFWRKIVKVELCSHNPGLRVDRMAIAYRLDGDRESSYVREVDVEVLFPADKYQATFYWTGQGKVTTSPLKGAIKVEVIEHTSNAHDICRVYFGDTLPKGKKHNFAYKMHFSDATHPVRPFLGHNVNSPLKELTMKVQLLPNQEIKQYKRQFFINTTANLPLWEQIVPVNNPENRLLEWTIPKPKLYYYRITW